MMHCIKCGNNSINEICANCLVKIPIRYFDNDNICKVKSGVLIIAHMRKETNGHYEFFTPGITEEEYSARYPSENNEVVNNAAL
jgi:hypothetical protein